MCIGLFLLSFFILPVSFAGTWVPVSVSIDPFCSQQLHVMCSEQGLIGYDPATGLIPYSDREGSDRTFLFCAISDIGGTQGFRLINGTEHGISSFTDLKRSGLLVSPNPNAVNYGGDFAQHFDENCNADEVFFRNPGGSLDFTRYIENGVVYDVLFKESNVNDFDIIAVKKNTSTINATFENLVNLGSFLSGTFIDTNNNVVIQDVNVTLYFKNQRGSSIPYMSFKTNDFGFFTTNTPRTITTYFATYEDVSLIPKTTYIMIAKHPLYEDLIVEIDLSTPKPAQTFHMTPFGVCQSDCTFEGSNLCRSECHGINGCSFGNIDGNTAVVIDALHLVPKGTVKLLSHESKHYRVDACIGDPVETTTIPVETTDSISSCPEGKSAWKTERLVTKDGEVVRLVLTVCR